MSETLPKSISNSLRLNLEISFRLARRDDLPKLEWFGEYTHFRRVFQHTYQEQSAGRRLMLLAVSRNFPIGHIFIFLREMDIFDVERRGYLYSFRVMQPFQGLGIGSELMRRAESVLWHHGYNYATIGVAKDNTAARRLYERSGYVVYSEDEGRWSYTDHEGRSIQVNEPSWLLEKALHTG